MGDKELDIIIDFSRGDEKAFRVLYDKYVVALRYFAAKYLNEDTMIDDVVQDAFVDLWEKRVDFRGEYAVKAYLYKAVRNDCLNLMRHQQVEDKYARRVVMEGEDSESFLDRILESEIFQPFQGFGRCTGSRDLRSYRRRTSISNHHCNYRPQI